MCFPVIACGDSPDTGELRASLDAFFTQVHAADMGGGLIGTVLGLVVAQVVAIVAPQAATAAHHGIEQAKDWMEKAAKKLGEVAGKRAAKRIDKFKLPHWMVNFIRFGRRFTKKNHGHTGWG